MSDYQQIYYPETKFGGFSRIDGTVAFYTRVRSLLTPSSVVADVGCGCIDLNKNQDACVVRTELRQLKGHCQKVIGIDVDEAASKNTLIDEFRLIRGKSWPIESTSVDLCMADFVLEHIEDPISFFSEVARIVKPGGYVCFRTPNRFSYFGILASLIPNRYHRRVVERVQSARQGVYPTYYRCNTKGKLRRLLGQNGFDSCIIGYEAEPSYFSFSRFLYYLAVLHQRLAPEIFRVNLFVFGRKRTDPDGHTDPCEQDRSDSIS